MHPESSQKSHFSFEMSFPDPAAARKCTYFFREIKRCMTCESFTTKITFENAVKSVILVAAEKTDEKKCNTFPTTTSICIPKNGHFSSHFYGT